MSRYRYAPDDVKYRISEAMRRMGLEPPDSGDDRGDRGAAPATDDRLFLSASQISRELGLPGDAVAQRLARHRTKDNHGRFWRELADPKPRQARYLYQFGAARQLLRNVRPVSGEKKSSRKNP